MLSALLAWCSLAAFVVRLVLLARLHGVSDRHPVREAVSDYGIGPTAGLFRTMAGVAAAAWLLLAAATWLGWPDWSDRVLAVASFALIALCTLGVAAVPTDLEGLRLTRQGALHYALAIAQFALIANIAGNVARLVGGPGFAVLRWITVGAVAATCVCLLPGLRRFFGAAERAFIVSAAVFFGAFALVTALHP